VAEAIYVTVSVYDPWGVVEDAYKLKYAEALVVLVCGPVFDQNV
jgi:hypothetical protein